MTYYHYSDEFSPRLSPPLPALKIPHPVVWAREKFGFEPDPVQARLLDSAARRLALCCCRQWGKSTLTALKAVHYAWFHPGSLVVVAAPTLSQAAEWLLKARSFLLRLGAQLRRDGAKDQSLLLPNGSRLVALPAVPDHVRGLSAVSLLLLDEAAFVPDELFRALTPMLAVSNGALWVLSTPASQSGLFYDLWHAARPDDWLRLRVTADDCPRIQPEFLLEQRAALGEIAFRRDFLCEFVAADTQVLSRELIESALDASAIPLNGGKPLWSR